MINVKNMGKYRIVVSAVNLVEGGTLTILQNCLSAFSDFVNRNQEYEVIAIVNDKKRCFYPNIHYIELKWPKKKWIYRIYCEYFYFNRLSKRLKAYLWFSLHDITPNVTAEIRAVYCHNPTPFYNPAIVDIRYNYKEWLFALFYRYLYRINIDKNTYVIVQQNSIRNEFSNMFPLRKKQIIVAPPVYKEKEVLTINVSSANDRKYLFFFPSFPRTFKNFEVICQACSILDKEGVDGYRVILTIDGNENRYSAYVYEKYKLNENIDFCGLLSRDKVFALYESANCLIFPSKLETWGLPISEFALYGKPMIVADLPYAHETAAGLSDISFFNPNDSAELALRMKEIMEGDFSNFGKVPSINILSPFVTSWEMLFNYLLKDLRIE